ncbi:MAG: hypothetical protein COA79_12430 [Planctomycetota bacterium]|nr:MAG: hypothetical protein COA79_12430 [Planctomycetota bacterium]
MLRNLYLCFLLFIFVLSLSAEDFPLGKLIQDGPATPEQISLYLPVTGELDESIIAHVKYKKDGTSKWLIGHPLHRIRPAATGRKAPKKAYAGVLWDLTSGTTYNIEVTLKKGDISSVKKISLKTRTLPPVTGKATTKIAASSTSAQIQSIWNAAKPGDIIEFANGTYNVDRLQFKTSGSIDKPIVIRGESREGVILKDVKGNIIQVLECSYITLENLTLEGSGKDSGTKSASKAVSFWTASQPQVNFTFRNLNIRGVDMGIMASKAIRGVLIYDNTFNGNNLWKREIITTNSTWNDDGIRIPGQGNSCFNNTFYGFGDCLAMNDRVFNVGVHFFRNDILMTGDDAFEGDYGHRNITFYDNRIQNSQTFISMDPMLGGPVFCFRNISINTGRGPYKLNNKNTGLFIYNNTVVRTNGFGSGKSWGWVQFNNGPLVAWGYCNNLLIWHGKGNTFAMESRGQNPLDFTNNGWYPDKSFWWTGTGGSARSMDAVRKKLPATKPVFGKSTKRHENDIIIGANQFAEEIKLGPDFLTEIKKQYIPKLSKKSKALGAGVAIPAVTDGFTGKAPDIGAVITGRKNPEWGDRSQSKK